jgi:SulP family sulfate permease
MKKNLVPQLFDSLKGGYSFLLFRKDLIAGITVGIVALPLAMAFGIASGVTPAQGLYTAIIAGFLISFLGGSRVQIGGPTGAFVVIVYDIIQRQGYEGLVVATLLAGLLLIVMGICKIGSWIKYIPYPLITGFTSGIAVIIFSSQIKDFFGLKMGTPPADFFEKWGAYLSNISTFDPTTLCIGGGTLALILFFRRFFPMLPWGILSIGIATFIAGFFHLNIATIHSQFGDLPRTLPFPSLPSLNLSFSMFHSLIPDALVIALLAGIESLLSAVVADGMTGGKHKSNCELVAQGVANLGSVLFGGIPATGAIARTATNVKTGAKTPIAGIIHAITLFLVILAFAPWVSMIPLAALSAVLLIVAWNMSEVQHFFHLLKAPPGDVVVLLTTFFLTVFVDLTVGVEVGMVLAAFLFVKRMSDISKTVSVATLLQEKNGEKSMPSSKEVPKWVEIYEINGPFFFGAADSLKDVLHNIELPPKVFILQMRKVPVIDATGMFALKELYTKCQHDKTQLFLCGIQSGPLKSIRKFGLEELIGKKQLFHTIDEALKAARKSVEQN